MADNLILKGSTWHVRLELPSDVRHAFGNRRKLTKSLKTGNKAEAHIRKLPVLAEWKTVISKARNGISAEELENELYLQKRTGEALAGFFESTLLKHIRGEKLFTKENALSFIKVFDSDISIIFKNEPREAKAWRLRFYELGSRFYDQKEGKQNTDLVADFLKATEDFLSIKNKFFSKNSGYSDKQANQITDTFVEPSSYSPKSPFTSQRLDAFAKHQVEIKGLAQKTVDTFTSKLKVLKNYLESNGLELSFESYQQFLDSLNVSTKTKKNHIHAGSSFHKWASKYDSDYKSRYDTRDNPFLGHELPNDKKKGKKKEEKRLAFKAEEVKKLYEFAISKRKYQVAYAIKIAGLTGCRIEEICRLTKSHIVAENGVLSLYIEEGKTDASIRKIPLHSSLKPLIDQLVKNADEDGYLIHSSGGNKYGIRSDSISKAFGRIKRELGYDARYVFHSIRKTVITSLQHNDVKPLVIASIVGHETGTVTFDIYSDGASAKQKLDAIKTLPAF
ncbi:tyrosine-type recombinase/integrase [Vreelandella titanicae]|uniref:tyrosine-type recombinase/integrase n=1 Tax=Vreelandella titanicae TaxID=664683 RepID=UPI0024201817|nr:tyrosine-type recombinase/integrase [Halomonas titanicae]